MSPSAAPPATFTHATPKIAKPKERFRHYKDKEDFQHTKLTTITSICVHTDVVLRFEQVIDDKTLTSYVVRHDSQATATRNVLQNSFKVCLLVVLAPPPLP
ncbi:hypothetical protein JOB18_037194 [Solea senegalensis]|uniref:Uncharacterized protein n=1 Tax=Solea senegalensis TaxID=28829 RepID=A0AAV6SLZ9_SOLSE|nr:hypothetical protein JOB18_037194 [Solea senegalensis]